MYGKIYKDVIDYSYGKKNSLAMTPMLMQGYDYDEDTYAYKLLNLLNKKIKKNNKK